MSFEILPGLPAYGAQATTFSPDGTGHHAEGLVIDFDGNWIGNFSKGKTSHDALFSQFAPHHAHVISGGNHYVIDVKNRSVVLVARDWLGASLFSQTANLVIVFDLTCASAYRESRRIWKTERIAWDGIRSVSEVGNEIHGEAYDPISDTWEGFRLDAYMGSLIQAAYPSQGS